ncbi:putative spermidine/putrescine transport system ATP-binding protein [Herbaspirillum sp. Sphag1AN]|uniref:ABC transporter ATP-binding protein n=1 Tax=unclassified Herbaspirillum TaxID=2624150 RepID=UPI00160C5731|nr:MULTISPECIES: ABC transporter ATP-binding protein [unclassified Herbaspirillum]MBB3212445.1 putative spermidine/putrescine transport system ATP-binding protein [Herbaspirillum sp. Sphag1AN]MBB3245456.1 putative spermidine/putrescine transport system ATP-binding protein [Herbaspirillum sp. Sphag64]
MSFLTLKGLSKRYGDVTAVAACDLSVEKGEFISLLGPSGCGKTTTLQMVAGFVQPTTGRIYLDGRDITDVKPSRRGLGIVFQNYALFPHMTVADNVSFGMEMQGVPSGERRKRVTSTLELVHLGAMANRYPRELSGGQRQRVALARALAIQPPVLLLDEPMGALDAKLREEMQIELRALQHRVGVTTIMVTHDQAEAMTLSDRVVLMNKACIEQVGRPFDMYEHPNGRFSSTFLGKANVFEGRRSQTSARVEVGELFLPTSDTECVGSLEYIVRPEKIQFSTRTDALLQGVVSARVFLGNHWLFQVETPLGSVQLTHVNAGAPQAAEGDQVGLHWPPEHARLVVRQGTAAGVQS